MSVVLSCIVPGEPLEYRSSTGRLLFGVNVIAAGKRGVLGEVKKVVASSLQPHLEPGERVLMQPTYLYRPLTQDE